MQIKLIILTFFLCLEILPAKINCSASLTELIESNIMAKGRGVINYFEQFHGIYKPLNNKKSSIEDKIFFSKDLRKLDQNSSILDAGSGESYFATQLTALFKYPKKFSINPRIKALRERDRFLFLPDIYKNKKPPHITSITWKMKRKKPKRSNLKYIIGKKFEEISNSEIMENNKQFNMITDYYGIFAYSKRPDKVIQRYLQMLSNDGSIYIVMRKNEKLISYSNRHQEYINKWLGQIEGVNISIKTTSDSRVSQTVRLSIKNKEKIRIPKFKEITYPRGYPPRREYIIGKEYLLLNE